MSGRRREACIRASDTFLLYRRECFGTKHNNKSVEVGKCISKPHGGCKQLLVLTQSGTVGS